MNNTNGLSRRVLLLFVGLLLCWGLPGCDDNGTRSESDVPSDVMETTDDVDVADTLPDTADVGDVSDEDVDPCDRHWSRQLTSSGLEIADGCGAELLLMPVIHADGEALEPSGEDCALNGETELVCTVSGVGELTLVDDESVARLEFIASADVRVQGLELWGPATVPEATGWLSNGFQSWSMSGVVALTDPPSEMDLERALASRGDSEVLRQGTHQLSWFHSWVGGGELSLVLGANAANVWKPWVQVSRADTGNALLVRLVSGNTGDSVTLARGESIAAEPWTIAFTENGVEGLNEELESWGTSLGELSSAPADAGWNSWYDLWDGVDEQAVRENAAIASNVLNPLLPAGAPPLRIVVDDGWQVLWGEWQPNSKFPSGLDGLAADLQNDGFETGVWLAPLLVDEESQLVTDNPAWFVSGLVYNHPKNGAMRVLDPTHPEAAAHLASVISTITGWGYDLLKIDFLFVGAWPGERYEDVTAMQAYHRALEIIREAAGNDVVLLAVGAPGLPSLPHVESWRIGWDIALEPIDASYPFIVDQARSISARWPLCLAMLCDADPPLLRTLPQNEVELGIQVAALTGGAFFLSDDLRNIPTERRDWLSENAVERGLSGVPAIPLEAFPDNPDDELVNGGVAHVLGYTDAWIPSVWALQDGSRLLINTQEQIEDIAEQSVPARSSQVVP